MIYSHTNELLLLNGDCIELMKAMPDNCVDSIVTDPPYGISFMGKAWDNARMLAKGIQGLDHNKDNRRSANQHAGTYDTSYSAGLLSSNNGDDMATVIAALDDIGYCSAWRVLDAQYFGVPQRRRRVFIVASLGNNWQSLAEILSISEGRAGYFEKSESKRKSSTGKTSDSIGSSESAVGNFELYDFPKEPIAPTLNATRSKDTMTWWDGSKIAATLGAKTNEGRMPDKGRMQMVVTDVVHEE
jgi:hypothetical protein